MNKICKAIFRAIHEGKWLQIEYRNKVDYDALIKQYEKESQNIERVI